MSFYRSETIKHYKLILPRDNAEQIMHSLGQQNLIHIVPLNAPLLDRPYVHQVKRCSQCLMKIRQIELILSDKNILAKREQFTNKQYEAFFNDWNSDYQQNKLNSINILDRIDFAVDQIYQIYKDSSKRIDEIKNKIQYLRENTAIIKAGMIKFGDSFLTDSVGRFDQINLQLSVHDMGSSKINMKAGVIKRKDEMILKRTIFRISRNNSFVFFVPYSDIFQKLEQKQLKKLVFFVLFSSPKGGVLDKKLDKFISTFSPQNYFIPQNIDQLSKYQKNLQQQLQQNEKLLALSQTQFSQYLSNIATFLPQRSFSQIQSYKMYFLKQKQIYNQLNQMQIYHNFLQASIYVRRNDILVLHKCLKQIQKKYNYLSGQLIQARQQNPPTYFIRNSYTCSAQQIVQTYGVARYKQANPSFFTTITFPFLFGVMFGDIAHGSLTFIFGLSMIFKKEYFQNNLFKMLIPHRYLITLMGFFSLYCGFIYNDFMSISLDIFGSCYNVSAAIPGQPIQRKSLQCVYAIGIDPVWSIAQNSINYIDSLKMKISVIIGVFHMILGIFVKGSNALYFKKKLDFCFQFLPQLIFMIVLFGYMDFLIIYKWLKPWELYDPTAPSIITIMINIPLRLGQTEDCCGGQPLWGVPGQTSQNSVQLFLLVIAVICVPLMLLPKPLIQIYGKKQALRDMEDIQENTEQKQILNSETNMQHQESSQIFVHQLIQTIEYVLGSISNTASYLRLWALSLAHSQLSQVFFQKTVQGGIQKGFIGIPIMIFGYPVLAGATLGVLLCMDSMQCFLHTLRLHWVQFQNKFYKGDGHPFIIFNFKTKRFQNQFEDLGRIGSGGFSTVYKVRNIRDRKMYALKIITIKPSQIKHQIYEYFERQRIQVKILSSLTHSNIVKYNGCWINAEMKTESQQEDFVEEIIEQQELQLVIDEYSSQSMGFQFERRSQSSQKSKKTKITKQKNKINKIDQNIYEIDLDKYKQIKIYLLSELGEITLQKYVQLRNEQKQKNQLSRSTFVIENYQFIGDIISGLEYLHGQRVIHRDIKLNNIILNTKKQCKIIDFGLAKKFKSIKLSNNDRNNNQNQEQFQYFNEKHSSCIGTKIFSSPQQATSQNYDHRTDIYSLGMVIGVLFSEYNTQYEQRQILMNLRNRKFDNFNMDERLKRILFECLGRQEQRPDLKQIKSVIKTLLKEQIQNNMQNFYKQKRDKNGSMELELNKQFRNLLNEKQLVKQNQ